MVKFNRKLADGEVEFDETVEFPEIIMRGGKMLSANLRDIGIGGSRVSLTHDYGLNGDNYMVKVRFNKCRDDGTLGDCEAHRIIPGELLLRMRNHECILYDFERLFHEILHFTYLYSEMQSDER